MSKHIYFRIPLFLWFHLGSPEALSSPLLSSPFRRHWAASSSQCLENQGEAKGVHITLNGSRKERDTLSLPCPSWNRENREKRERNETKWGIVLLPLPFSKCSKSSFFLLQVRVSLEEREEKGWSVWKTPCSGWCWSVPWPWANGAVCLIHVHLTPGFCVVVHVYMNHGFLTRWCPRPELPSP